MKVLIVEDERHVLHGLSVMIGWERLGFDRVFTAENGLLGWECFLRERPDLVLSDVYMPKMNGLELIKRIRGIDASVPVVILSGYGDFAYAQEAIALGVSRYIMKPSVYTEIERELQDIVAEINRSRHQEQLFRETQAELDRHLPVLREHFLYQLISGGMRQEEIGPRIRDFYRLDDTIARFGIVLTLRPHRTEEERTRTESDWQLYKFACSNIAEEVVRNRGAGYVLRYVDDRLPILLCGPARDELARRARQAAEDIVRCIGDYLDLNANVGIGGVYSGTLPYSASYHESLEMLSLGETEGYNQIFFIEDNPSLSAEWHQYPLDRIRLLAQALIQRDSAMLGVIWGEMRQQLVRGRDAPLSYSQTLCGGIITNLMLHLLEAEPGLSDKFEPMSIFRDMQRQTSPHSLYDWMRAQLDRLLALYDMQLNDRRACSYVEYVKSYIAEHYREPISFAELANTLGLARNYLSNLFTRETGISFVSYLAKYRIDKAKELLLANKYKSYQVAEMVGYQDPAYFSRMFKQITDMSPMEFCMKAKTAAPRSQEDA